MPEWQLKLHLVAVPAADSLALQIACVDQVGDDGLCRSFGDPDTVCDIPAPDLRIRCNEDEHVAMVGEERPSPGGLFFGHEPILIDSHHALLSNGKYCALTGQLSPV